MSDQEPVGGFPGFGFLAGYFTAYLEGLQSISDAYNRAWDASTNEKGNYTFGGWTRDVGKIWTSNINLFQKLSRYSVSDDGPVWLSIVADQNTSSAASHWVHLPKSVGSQQKLTTTDLERLGSGRDSIPGSGVIVDLNDQRDTLRATIPIKKGKSAKGKTYAVGTYVGFVTLPGGSGPPLAIIFFSYGT